MGKTNKFYIMHSHHLYTFGGLLHLNGCNISTVIILPFWQTGHLVRSTPQTLRKCSCQVTGMSFVSTSQLPRSSRHNAILSLRLLFASKPKCLILTNRSGNTWRRNLLMIELSPKSFEYMWFPEMTNNAGEYEFL